MLGGGTGTLQVAEVTIHEFKIVAEHADQVLLQTHHQRMHPAVEDHVCTLPAHLGRGARWHILNVQR